MSGEADTAIRAIEDAVRAAGDPKARAERTSDAAKDRRIAELEAEVKRRARAEATAELASEKLFARAEHFRAKVARYEDVTESQKQTISAQARDLVDLEEVRRADLAQTAIATVRALDAERRAEQAEQSAADPAARIAAAEAKAREAVRQANIATKKAAEFEASEHRAYLVASARHTETLREIVEQADRSDPKYAVAEARKELKKSECRDKRLLKVVR